jgi:NAD(P)-dependent dehydrogenase (short-subunit alcohol dehydrogenase family)
MSGAGLFDLTGRAALVTGASAGGLGAHAAAALAEAGARVAVGDLAGKREAVASTVRSLEERGAAALGVDCDVTSEAAVERAVAAVTERWGKLDILCNFAGVMLRKPALETEPGEWQRVLDVNLTGTFISNQVAARAMLASGGGTIVNVASIYVDIAGPIPEPAYYASKAGIANLTRGLAAEWGRAGIRVNCVAPGVFYPTRMTEPLSSDPERLDEMTRRTMLGRLGDPARDLSGTILYLCSAASDYVTGQVLYVDGGWTAW